LLSIGKTILQTLTKNSLNEKGEKSHNGGGQDDKKKEEKGKKSTSQMDPRVE